MTKHKRRAYKDVTELSVAKLPVVGNDIMDAGTSIYSIFYVKT